MKIIKYLAELEEVIKELGSPWAKHYYNQILNASNIVDKVSMMGRLRAILRKHGFDISESLIKYLLKNERIVEMDGLG